MPEVAALLAETFSPRGDEEALLRGWLLDEDRVPRVAQQGRELVGFGLASVTGSPDPATYAEPFGVDLAARFVLERVGVLNSLATRPSHRGTGVGLAVARALGEALHARRCDTWLGVSWQHGPRHTSTPFFRQAGFEELGRAAGYYRRYHDASGQVCAHCAPRPCDCVAVLFGRAAAPVGDRGP